MCSSEGHAWAAGTIKLQTMLPSLCWTSCILCSCLRQLDPLFAQCWQLPDYVVGSLKGSGAHQWVKTNFTPHLPVLFERLQGPAPGSRIASSGSGSTTSEH